MRLSVRVSMLGVALCAAITTSASEVIRREIAPGAVASVIHGRRAGLEVSPPQGKNARQFLQSYLAMEVEWVAYRGADRAFIPFDRLKPEIQRDVMLTLYPADTIDESGWTHHVQFEGETLFTLCEWLTGKGTNYKAIIELAGNALNPHRLERGQSFLVPRALLNGVMKMPTVTRQPPKTQHVAAAVADDVLGFGTDSKGDFATYRIRKGEALFTSVVVRFTDFQENSEILKACKIIAKRSGIRDVRDIDAGATITIPVEFVAARYLPNDRPEKKEYVASLRASELLSKTRPTSRDLSDVVIILDPGHGGADHGASHPASGLYEDEINYDIVCRIQAILKADTGARVYVTATDKSQGNKSTDAKRFTPDKDEQLLTNPRYDLSNARVGVNLRYMLVNSIYDAAVRRGVDPRKIIFTSIHTDSLFNDKLRGTMIYIPGAKYRRASENRTSAIYARYDEGRRFSLFTSTSAERQRDEAVSRNFANTLLEELGRKRIKRHDQGAPIRSQINRAGKKPMVPGVIRNTKVPTKILVETANLMNRQDRERLADPWWRQQFALAYVESLRTYFDAMPGDSSGLFATD